MSYNIDAIQGAYTVPEFAWEIYLILKKRGVMIRPDDSLIEEGEVEVRKNIWLNHCYTARTAEEYKGYFTLSKKNGRTVTDKYLLYIGDNRAISGLNDSGCFGCTNPGTPGSRRGSAYITSTDINHIFSNTVEMSTTGRLVPLVIITNLNKEIICHFPLGYDSNQDTYCSKEEGRSASDYLTNPTAYKHLYNTNIKTIMNDSVKIIELSYGNRSVNIPGQVVVGYIKNIGFNWITNFSTSSPYRHIGYQASNKNNYQYFLSFEPNNPQVYFNHGMKYSYPTESEIEYASKKIFTKGSDGIPSFGLFNQVSNDLLDCSNITAPLGSRVKIGDVTYYVIENTLVLIGE